MAQFSHADFGGMSQWSPGMSMVGDMFNAELKSKLDALCTDIVAHLDVSGAASSTLDDVSYRSEAGSPGWWPSGLGHPALLVDRTTCGTRSSRRCIVWSSTIVGSYPPMIPATIRFSGWLRLRAAAARSRSQAKTDW